ncbi:MAG: rod shape-determining protein MreD [Treponema sp.]|nr:rod shape-determining protein MreD [Treponema sp.]
MAKKVIWAVVFIVIAALFQSTIFSRLAVYIRAVPDLALGILVFTAYVNGTMTGQLTGFCSGFLLDFLSAAPLGLNALVRTLIGALTGFLKGTFFLDIVFLPMALCAGATALKALIYFLLHLLLAGAVKSYDVLGLSFWVEMGLNTLLAPFLFAFLKLFQSLLVGQREDA